MCRVFIKTPRFFALPDNASLLDIAISTGRSLRKCALTASDTALSETPFAIFARVFPVQGATTSKSSNFFGPNGSTSASVCDPFAETFRSSETCIGRISICRHYRHYVIARQSERFHLVYHFFECAERPAESVAYPRTSIFYFHIFHRFDLYNSAFALGKCCVYSA